MLAAPVSRRRYPINFSEVFRLRRSVCCDYAAKSNVVGSATEFPIGKNARESANEGDVSTIGRQQLVIFDINDIVPGTAA
jgi:hypothetical protein